jgi:Formamidopyrimidine-DNA glycosylase N-terminal domain
VTSGLAKEETTMPELPEVEVARRALEEHCVGKKIVKCTVDDDPKVIDGVSPSDLQSALFRKTILAALLKGKNLWIRLDSPPFPTFQFGQFLFPFSYIYISRCFSSGREPNL